ncbi:MAG: 50S ribosomal protein L30 [Nitrososphaerota archaeon]|jgi:large subunit ribosomal protein L30|nr:50S ribosomal protein L30 [Candidatus Termitimicrobium sp.]MDR0493905.1 50S ribosomal protein L30 [Nitrososphaerota archaeon]
MAQQTQEAFKSLIVIKIRGTISARRETRETLELLRLTHTNHAILIDSRPAYKGMLQRVNNYVTWGEPTKETLVALLSKRGRIAGNKKLAENIATTSYQSIDELADALLSGKIAYKNLPEIEARFKLHPPSKGYHGAIKTSFRTGGESGYRGEAINDLVKRMI